jgi:hemerythrin
MKIFSWEDRFFTGITQIDEHHLHLVSLLNTAYQDFLNQAAPKRLNQLFYELIDYATYHFSAEEQLMAQQAYPAMAKHMEEHQRFAERVVEMHRDYLDNRPIFLEILTFLKTWLESHILHSDGALGRFLAKNNS